MMRIHTSLHSPILEQAAGWAALHRTTTVQSATVSISGSHITGSALTATTTELQTTGQGSAGQQAAAQAASAVVAAAAATNSSHRTSHSLASMLGDLQHSLYTMLALHSAGGKISRAQLAAAAAASMPDEGRDIELHPHKVAQVVDRARVVQQLQRLANGEAGADVPGESDVRSSAEQTAVGHLRSSQQQNLGNCMCVAADEPKFWVIMSAFSMHCTIRGTSLLYAAVATLHQGVWHLCSLQ